MPKPSKRFECTLCQHVHPNWLGQCPECKAYNTMVEKENPGQGAPGGSKFISSGPRTNAVLKPTGLDTRSAPPPRTSTGHPELDRVLGGGLVEASAVLIGGDPGIGKSTLLLQISAKLSASRKMVYISGEESLDQIQLRAQRIGVQDTAVDLIASKDCLAIADYIDELPRGAVVVVDSIQTLHCGGDGTPGSVSQVKQAAAHLIPAAKSAGVTLILVSHVTKDGTMAGPNVVVHAVDVTLQLEADLSGGLYRLMRSEKNRFGGVDEVGVFEMTERGLADVENPSEVFIAQRDSSAFGSVIFPSLEGSRPVLIEVQALVVTTSFGTGRRSATGWDTNRLNMLLATISARLGLTLIDSDVYVNIAGGMKVSDPALDLAAALAILSAYTQTALPTDLAVFGEIGLAGEVRNAARAEARIKEAAQLGLGSILCPSLKDASHLPRNTTYHQIKRVSEVFNELPDLKSAYATSRR